MSQDRSGGRSAELSAAWATAVGGGALSLMLTWLVVSRLTEALLPQPAAAVSALVAAMGAAVVVTARLGARLVRTVDTVRSSSA